MKNKKILCLSSHLGVGGSEIQLRRYCIELVKKKIKVSVVVFNVSENHVFNKELELFGIRVFQCPFRRPIFKFIYLYYVIIVFQPAILHSWNSYLNPIIKIVSKLFFNIKTIGSIRGSVKNEILKYSPFRRKLILDCDQIVVNSEEIINDLAKYGLLKANVKFMPNLVNFENNLNLEIWPILFKTLGIRESDFILINIGNYRFEKNQILLIEIVNQLVKKGLPVKCLIIGQIIAGQNELYSEMKNLINKYKLEEFVFLTGFIKDTSILLSKGDIYIHTSSSEGMSNAILEAMTMGRCVISTAIGGAKQLIKNDNNGVLVDFYGVNDKTTIDKFVIAIEKLFYDRQTLLELGNNAKYTIKEKHNSDFIINSFIRLF